LPHLNPDWFYLSGAGLLRFSWKRGRYTGVIVVVIVFGYLNNVQVNTQPFNGPLSGTTRVSRYKKGKTNLDFTEARESEWQLHQLGHMQACTLLQIETTPAPRHSVFYRPDALPAAQPTASNH